MAPLVVMASTGVMAPLGLEANGANLGLLGRKESQESKDPRGYMDGQGHPEKGDHLAQMELKDRQESEESKASRGCMGTQGHLGKMGQLDHEDHQDREDHRDREDHQDCEDCEVRQDLQDRQDHAAVRGGKGLEVDRVRGVDQGKEDSRVREDRRDHRVGIAVTIRHDLVVTVLRGLAAVASISLAVTGMVSHAPGVQGTTT